MAELNRADEEAMIAAAELVGRTGATAMEVGYLHDDVPIEEASWWATAQYKGVKLMAEKHRSPIAALEELARRLLTGAQCQHCMKLVALEDGGAMAHDVTLLNGQPWSVEEQAEAGLCHWRRVGPTWVRGCEASPEAPEGAGNRAARRRAHRAARSGLGR